MKNQISERIGFILKELGHNSNSFSKAIGLSNNVTIGRILNNKCKPSANILEKIITNFDQINANWLLTGEGEVFKSVSDTSDLSHKQKLITYLGTKGISESQFINTTGYNKDFLRNNNNVACEELPTLRKYYPDLNIDWLLMDTQPMILNKENGLSEANSSNNSNGFNVTEYLREKDELLKKANEEIGKYKQQIEDLRNQLAEIKNQ